MKPSACGRRAPSHRPRRPTPPRVFFFFFWVARCWRESPPPEPRRLPSWWRVASLRRRERRLIATSSSRPIATYGTDGAAHRCRVHGRRPRRGRSLRIVGRRGIRGPGDRRHARRRHGSSHARMSSGPRPTRPGPSARWPAAAPHTREQRVRARSPDAPRGGPLALVVDEYAAPRDRQLEIHRELVGGSTTSTTPRPSPPRSRHSNLRSGVCSTSTTRRAGRSPADAGPYTRSAGSSWRRWDACPRWGVAFQQEASGGCGWWRWTAVGYPCRP